MYRLGTRKDKKSIEKTLKKLSDEKYKIYDPSGKRKIIIPEYFYILYSKNKIYGYFGIYRYSDHVCYIDVISENYFTLCEDIISIFSEVFKKYKIILAVTQNESYGKTVIKFFKRFGGAQVPLNNKDILCIMIINNFQEVIMKHSRGGGGGGGSGGGGGGGG